MSVYRYKGRRRDNGALVTGEIPAATASLAADQLLGRGIEPIDLQRLAHEITSRESLFSPWPSHDDLLMFSRQMHTLIRSGVPLLAALRTLTEVVSNPRLRHTLEQVVVDLQKGRGLAAALSAHPRIFTPIFVNMVAIGEETGMLNDVFQRLALFLQAEKESRNQLSEAVRYPILVLIAILAAMVVVQGFVLPAFVGLFTRFGAELPWATRLLLSSSRLFTTYGWMLAIGVAALFGVGWVLWQQEAWRKRFDCAVLNIPVIAYLVRQASLARFARAFSMASQAGLPIAQILQNVAAVMGNRCLQAAVLTMQAGIDRGEGLLQSAQSSRFFPPLVLQMLAVGEESGSLAVVMGEVADHYDRELAYQIRRLGAMLEPLVLLVVGIMVLLLAVGIFLPMWRLGSAALHP